MTRTATSHLDDWPVQALAATLDLKFAAALPSLELPPLWHWLYFLRTPSRSQMNVDGHPLDTDLVDPADPRRRMFASARIHFEKPLLLGVPAFMTESIIATRDTEGASGAIRIVTFQYEYVQRDQLCIREQRDIVYLQVSGQPTQRKSIASGLTATPMLLDITPDPVLLMRFSALTFNAHRIHYDQHYAQHHEGYPERVVHGPLVAILLAELLRANVVGRLKRFEFRAQRPLFVNQPIRLAGNPQAGSQSDQIMLEAQDVSGVVAMQATAWV